MDRQILSVDTTYTAKITERVVADVLRSGSLGSSKRQARLLSFLLDKSLDGDISSVSANSIAVDLFGRPEDFDDKTDSIVRVEMHRLRKNVAAYNNVPDRKFNLSLEPASFEIQLDDASASTTVPAIPATNAEYALSSGEDFFLDKRAQSIAHRDRALNLFTNQRVFWLTFIIIGFIYLTLTIGQNFLSQRSNPLDGITLNESYKARIYVKVDNHEQSVSQFVNDLATNVASLMSEDFKGHGLAMLSDDQHSDYQLSLTPTVDETDSREKLSAVIYTKGGKLIWSHIFDLDPDLLNYNPMKLADRVDVELLQIVDFVVEYHKDNPEIDSARRNLYACVSYALSHTMPGRDPPEYLGPNETPLDCLKPEYTSNESDQATIHALRADYYIHAHIGNVSVPIEAGKTYLDKVYEELDLAETIFPLPILYYLTKLRAHSFSYPEDTDGLKQILSDITTQFPDTFPVQMTIGFDFAYYLNDWDNGLKWADISVQRSPDYSAHVYRLYATHALLNGRYEDALRYRVQLPDSISTLVAVEDTVLYCLAGQPFKARLQAAELKKYDLHDKDKFIAYVKKRNFHPSIEALYTDSRVFSSCETFKDA